MSGRRRFDTTLVFPPLPPSGGEGRGEGGIPPAPGRASLTLTLSPRKRVERGCAREPLSFPCHPAELNDEGSPLFRESGGSVLVRRRQFLEPRIRAQRIEVRVDPEPGRRDEVGHLHDRLELIERLLRLPRQYVDPRQLVLEVRTVRRVLRDR